MKYTVSAIVPAYDKEVRISDVLKVLAKSKDINETICVYDGNDPHTLQAIKSIKKIKLLHSKKKHGKANAMGRGVEKAKSDIILFVDADIRGFTEKTIKQLIQPLQSGNFDCSLGYRSSTMEASFGVPLSGERAYFKKDLEPHVKKFESMRYGGVELYLNYHFKNKRTKILKLHGVYSYAKHHKYSTVKATRLYAFSTYELISEIIRQKNPMYFLKSYMSYVYLGNKNLEEHIKFIYRGL